MGLTTANENGSISTTFTIPAAPVGVYNVYAWDLTTGANTDPVTFEIPLPVIEISPTSGPVGRTVTVSGENFTLSGDVQIWFDIDNDGLCDEPDENMGLTTANENGSISTTFTIPAAPVGVYNVYAWDLTTGDNTGPVEFTVVPGVPAIVELTADPTSILADGISTSIVTATVKDEYGRPVAGENVVFSTDKGIVYPLISVTGADGTATTTLTASTTVENARVTATLVAYPEIENSVIVSFVSDTFEISLNVGWNLISLPLVPVDENIEVVLAGLDVDVANVEVVWAYDATTKTWLVYTPGPAPDTLLTIEDGKGYWIKMKAPATLTVYGFVVQAGPGVTPPTYDVVAGWNLIGFKSTVNRSASDYLSGIAGKWVSLWTFKPGIGYQRLYGTDNMEPGLAYWIYMLEQGTIVP
jgi:hypothetical protein